MRKVSGCFNGLPYDGLKAHIPKPAFDFSGLTDYITINHVGLFSITLAVVGLVVL